ncbi:MAG: trehalose-6-phosphate synthase [Candidatus Andersenbacteria bacterium]|nr:trehalose-6-phosphate synthase [Candidatus Andersenbacteria bacterium]
MTSAKDLASFARDVLGRRKFVAAIQREPYSHVRTDGSVTVERSIGGVTILLDGILRTTGGLMVATAAGNADSDVVDAHSKVRVPPGEESYELKRIFLTPLEQKQFYYGFSNQTLWPLCHAVFVKPVFRSSWWQTYAKVNYRFAQAILEEIGGEEAFVWINDFQLALLPKILRELNPHVSIGLFWHTPWPTVEIFRICPWRRDILEGLLGADLIGFHRHYHVGNFIDSLREEIGVVVESEPLSVLYRKRLTKLIHLPTGIDTEEIDRVVQQSQPISRTIFQQDLGLNITSKYLVLSVDRVDYTKGMVERLRILDRFLEKYPHYRQQLTHLMIGVPSRLAIPAYKTYSRKVNKLVQRINDKYRHNGWQPIHFVARPIERNRLFAYYHLADIGLVTPLDDGMNLVAKEFAIAAEPNKGVLLLSRFAGAAKDLYSAIHTNPYDTDGSADALNYALNTSQRERQQRNADMRRVLEENNMYRWGIEFIKQTTSENLAQKYL